MSAHVFHKFRKGFLLDEARLRKLHDILRKKLETKPGAPKLKFTIDRADAYSYKTETIDDIFKETNTEYEIELNGGDALKFELHFDADPDETYPAILHAMGEDRDFVYVLTSDLKSYLTDEVIVCPRFSRITRLLLVFTLFLILPFCLLLFVTQYLPLREDVTRILETDDINLKINYLIKKAVKPNDEAFFPLAIAPLFALALFMAERYVEKIWNFFFPANVFLVGKEIERYYGRKDLR
jgi:hypothetical protein